MQPSNVRMFIFKPQPFKNDIFNDIFSISHPNNVKLGTALTRDRSETPVKFEIHRTNGSRDMQLTDRQTDRQTDIPVIYR